MLLPTLLLAQLQLAPSPIASIGVLDGDTLQALSNVMSATEDARGHLYVLQSNVPYVAVFDSIGRRVATLGRMGGGPGEFALPAFVSVVGDSVWVSDARLRKLSLFGPDFMHVRDVVLNSDFPELARLVAGGVSPSPEHVSRLGFAANARTRDSRILLFQPWDGAAVVVAEARADEVQRTFRVGGRMFSMVMPVVETPFIVTRDDRAIVVRRKPTLSAETLGRNGEIVASTRLDLSKERVPESVVASLAERIAEAIRIRQPSVSVETIMSTVARTAEPPDSSYFVRTSIISPDGALWLRQAIPDGPQLFHRIAGDGSVDFTLIEPVDQVVLSIRGRAAWVLELDEYDVPYLRRYRFADGSR